MAEQEPTDHFDDEENLEEADVKQGFQLLRNHPDISVPDHLGQIAIGCGGFVELVACKHSHTNEWIFSSMYFYV